MIDDVNVRVSVSREQYLDADGKLITEDYRVLLKSDIQKALQTEFNSLTDFLRRWNQAVPNGSELDTLDLVAHVAFNQKPLTRRERANKVKECDVFGKYSEQARAVLEALLEKLADYGVQDIENAKVLELPPFD